VNKEVFWVCKDGQYVSALIDKSLFAEC